MAIKTNYMFRGVEIPGATLRVIRIFGSSKEGWNSLVGVYNTELKYIPTEFEREEALEEVLNLIEEFNFQTPFSANERGYISVYKALQERFGGVEK